MLQIICFGVIASTTGGSSVVSAVQNFVNFTAVSSLQTKFSLGAWYALPVFIFTIPAFWMKQALSFQWIKYIFYVWTENLEAIMSFKYQVTYNPSMAIETIQSHEGFNSSLNTTPFFLVPPSAIVTNVLNACHRIFIQTLTKAAEHFRKTGHRTYAFYWRRDTWGHSKLRDLINQYRVECTSSWPKQELCQQTTRKADQ